MPDKDGEQNDPAANERGLHQPDLSLTEIDKRPHQATAPGAGEKRTGKIESARGYRLIVTGEKKELGKRDGKRNARPTTQTSEVGSRAEPLTSLRG